MGPTADPWLGHVGDLDVAPLIDTTMVSPPGTGIA